MIKTGLHTKRLCEQIERNLINLQRDMNQNAQTHRAMAVAQSPPFAVLQSFVNDCATQYLRRLQWITDLEADKRQSIMEHFKKIGIVESDVWNLTQHLLQAALGYREALTETFTYADIVRVCDQLIAQVDAPESLWPE